MDARWLPSRLAALVRRGLTRYRGAVACQLPTGSGSWSIHPTWFSA